MNSRQLRWILSGDKFTKLSFKSVHAMDEMKLIKTVSYPSSYVINLDPSYKPGSHWVAVYFDRNGESEYFDSLGRYPPHEVEYFLCLQAKRWKCSHMQVQEIYTTTCGQFVVFYICEESRGLTLKVIFHKYFSSHNKLRNDLFVRDFVILHYHHDAHVKDFNFISCVGK